MGYKLLVIKNPAIVAGFFICYNFSILKADEKFNGQIYVSVTDIN